MYRSAIEEEIRFRASLVGAVLRGRDRGVFLGLLLSVVPIPPVALVGIAVNLLNLRLLASGRLPVTDRRLIRMSLAISLVNLAVCTVVCIWLFTLAMRLQSGALDMTSAFFDYVRYLLDRLFGGGMRLPATRPGVERI